jgi:hypothetical protein
MLTVHITDKHAGINETVEIDAAIDAPAGDIIAASNHALKAIGWASSGEDVIKSDREVYGGANPHRTIKTEYKDRDGKFVTTYVIRRRARADNYY